MLVQIVLKLPLFLSCDDLIKLYLYLKLILHTEKDLQPRKAIKSTIATVPVVP